MDIFSEGRDFFCLIMSLHIVPEWYVDILGLETVREALCEFFELLELKNKELYSLKADQKEGLNILEIGDKCAGNLPAFPYQFVHRCQEPMSVNLKALIGICNEINRADWKFFDCPRQSCGGRTVCSECMKTYTPEKWVEAAWGRKL